MVSIGNFPTEILFKIFGEIDIADIYNLKRTCRLFYEVSEHSRHTCVFKIDAKNHPTWKLIKYILRNQRVGNQISRIYIEWHRRGIRPGEDDLSGKEQWTWTEREIQTIKNICQGNMAGSLELAILGGINSESLLPLLLMHTPRLEYLDLGTINVQLISHDPEDVSSHKHVLRTFLDILNDDYRRLNSIPGSFAEWCESTEFELTSGPAIDERLSDWDKTRFSLLCEENFGDLSQSHVSPSYLPGSSECLWLHSAIVWELRLPGLSNLKHFRGTINGDVSLAHSISHYHILGGENMETFMANRCFSREVLSASQRWWGTQHAGLREIPTKMSTKLRRLELVESQLTRGDLEMMANTTVSLEYLAIHEVVYPPRLAENQPLLEDVIAIFLENNKRLSMDGIIIVDVAEKQWGNGYFGEIEDN
ncbi:hypothetical protein TWF718_007739 [Orbilia javanica]|uniref:F-box domain-containing protein n=1 Tax=Orbilia javanica TaxID=47235 RepID=A0AAN8MVZ9_9PEZI